MINKTGVRRISSSSADIAPQRDPVGKAPRYPEIQVSSSGPRRTRARASFENSVRLYVNRTLLVLRSLLAGVLREPVCSWEFGSEAKWDRPGVAGN